MQREVVQAGEPESGLDGRHAGDRLRFERGGFARRTQRIAQHTQGAAALADQRIAAGQQCNGEGMIEPPGDNRHHPQAMLLARVEGVFGSETATGAIPRAACCALSAGTSTIASAAATRMFSLETARLPAMPAPLVPTPETGCRL